MGIFDRWLIACDFDNTITNTHGVPVPEKYISEENAAAIRLYQKSGFEIEGTSRHTMRVNGVYKDEYQMSNIIPEEA